MAVASTSALVNGFIVPPPLEELLDKKKFDETIKCTSLRADRKFTQSLVNYFQGRLFDKPHTRNITWLLKLDGDSGPETMILLKEDAVPDTFSEDDRNYLQSIGAKVGTFDVLIDFHHRSVEWLLSHYHPQIPNIVNSFELVGHIAHVNLRGDEMLEAKYTIGAIILEKSRDMGIRTVVNKVGAVDNEFRVLPMELLAGDPDTMVEVLESLCTFRFDFKEVFWNSRLQAEHQRIIQMMKVSDVVCDMFAGVGPFAVPLARKLVKTYANDLNPKSYEWMLANAQLNIGKRKIGFLSCYCLDGRAFARKMFQEERIEATHVLMNLPKLAPEFCDVFVKLFPKGHPLPRVHVYCFGTGETPKIMEERALARIQTALGGVTLPEPDLQVLKIRQTSTNTLEFCISFTVPASIAYMDEDA